VIELLPLTLVCLYFVPFMIAAARDHDSFVAILIVNALLGWTGIGWIACMLWASFSPARGPSVAPQPDLRRIQ
jgi:hypothetical protein